MLKISVDYYNKEEEELFKKYPNYTEIKLVATHDISIPKGEFLTYLLFTEQKDKSGFKTYEELSERIESRWGDIDDYLNLSEGSIQAKFIAKDIQAAGLTERLGVSLGLNVINKIHELSEADWAITTANYVDGVRLKDFDYVMAMASDGKRYIQVENKGNICKDNTKKTSSVSKHYKSIKEKKKVIRDDDTKRGVPVHQNIYYGTIAVLDVTHTAKVFLVDPPSFDLDWSPEKFKLITRLEFYLAVFKEIEVHNSIIRALKERIAELIQSNSIQEFNNKPLINTRTYLKEVQFAIINDSEAFGRFFFVQVNEEIKVFILALTKTIIKLVISQNFEALINYDYRNDELNENVTVYLYSKLKNYNQNFENSNIKFVFDEKRKRYYAQEYTHLYATSSGRIFGILK